MIYFENVSKFLLSEVNLHIPQGTTVGLIGASGSGKTTFLKLACGLLQPEQGTVYTMRSLPVRNRKHIGKNTGVFFADFPLLQENHTVESNFEDLKMIYRFREDLFLKEYGMLAERLGFGSYAKEQVNRLSLGQRRRAELGAVLLKRPKLLLLDEPTTGLDQTAKDTLGELLEERKKEGMTLVISSHNMEEISNLCERIALLNNGRFVYYGDKELLLKRFAPIDTMELTLSGRLPDLEDLPVLRYSLHQNLLKLTYNSNHISSAELLRHILKQTSVAAVTMQKAGLADVIRQIEKGETNEFY